MFWQQNNELHPDSKVTAANSNNASEISILITDEARVQMGS
jgi:hypothetical protein